jgi:hypothetical protein
MVLPGNGFAYALQLFRCDDCIDAGRLYTDRGVIAPYSPTRTGRDARTDAVGPAQQRLFATATPAVPVPALRSVIVPWAHCVRHFCDRGSEVNEIALGQYARGLG